MTQRRSTPHMGSRLKTTTLALLLSARCDSDHKNALFCRVLQKTRRLMRNIPLTAGASSSRSYLSRSARARLGEPNRSHGMPHLLGGLCLSLGQSKLPLQFEIGSFKSVLDVVFDDALSSNDLCIPIGEVGLCSKDTDIEVIDDRPVLLLERGSQHALELLGRLSKFVR